MLIKNLNKFLSADKNSVLTNLGFSGTRINATDGYRLLSLDKSLFTDLPDGMDGQLIDPKTGIAFDCEIKYPNVQKILNAAKLSAHTGERLILIDHLRADLAALKEIQKSKKQLMFFGGDSEFTESHKYKNLLLDSQRGNAEIIKQESITKPYSVTFQNGKIYAGYQIKKVTHCREYGRKTIKRLEQYAHHTVKSESVNTFCFQNLGSTFNLKYLISILETALNVLKADKKLSMKYYQSSEVSPLWFSIFSDDLMNYSELLLMPIKP